MCKRITFIILCSMLFLSACEEEEYTENSSQIVVEGWIESGSGPVVMLTKSFTINKSEVPYEEDESIVLPWGKVTVSDGIQSVVLTGDPDDSYFPPFRYSTSKIRGVPGRTYYLFVECGSQVLTAQTTIPLLDSLEALRVTPCTDMDSMYQITAYYEDNPNVQDNYLFLIRVFNKEARYYPSFLGVVDDDRLDTYNQQVVQPGVHNLTSEGNKYHPYFHKSDSVLIKFAKIDDTTCKIHKAYNEMVSLSSNPIFTSDISMPTNIQGGLGFWCGYAVTKYSIIIADSIK